jgi:hypothetical protein
MDNNLLLDRDPVRALPPARADRRRPGRLASVPEELIPLLRAGAQLRPDSLGDEFDDPDQLRPARGLGLGLLCSLLLWVLLGASAWCALTMTFQGA